MKSDQASKVLNLADDQTVCYCSQVTKGTIKKAIQSGANSVKALQESTHAGIGNRCRELNPRGLCCHSDLNVLIQRYGNLDPDNDDRKCDCCHD